MKKTAAKVLILACALLPVLTGHEQEIAELLGIPYEEYTQVALIPIAYTRGTDFKRAYRPPVEEVMHFNTW